MRIALALLACALVLPACHAGPVTAPVPVTMSDAEANRTIDSLDLARRLGTFAGNDVRATRYFVGGILLGVPTSAALIFTPRRDNGGTVARTVAPIGVGALALLTARAVAGPVVPSAAARAPVALASPGVQAAFDSSYAGAVQARRGRRVAEGVVVGAVTTGEILLVVVFIQILQFLGS